MTNFSKIILTKSGDEQAVPAAGDLDLGELAINYNDGKLFFKDRNDIIRVIGSSASIDSAAAHIVDENNPHKVDKNDVDLSNVDDTADLAKPVSGPQQSALNLKANQSTTYNKIEVDNLISTQTGSYITLTDLSMAPVATASGTGGVTYDGGVFTYTPPTLSGLGGLLASDISVNQSAGGDDETGTLLYEGDGVFTFTKPTLSGLDGIGLTDLIVTNDSPLGGDGSLTYDNTSGEFIYDQPTLDGLGGGTIATQDSDSVSITGGAILASGGAESTGGGVLGYKSVAPGHHVTQETDKLTSVTINSVAGTINCFSGSTYNGNSLHPFTVNNTEVAETDVVVVSIQSESGASNVLSAAITGTTSGSFTISVINMSNSNVTATVILNFAIIKHINPLPV